MRGEEWSKQSKARQARKLRSSLFALDTHRTNRAVMAGDFLGSVCSSGDTSVIGARFPSGAWVSARSGRPGVEGEVG